jgi:hypothetical protein
MRPVKTFALAVALIGSLLAALCVAQPAVSATTAARHCPKTIDNADNGKTIRMAAGTCATLSLQPDLVWSTPVSSSKAVSVTDIPTFVRDSIWTLNAVHAGDATITSSGRPDCKPGQVCPLFIVEFTVHIHVVGPYGR